MSTVKLIVGNEITSYTNRNINLNIKLDSESHQQLKKQVYFIKELKLYMSFTIIINFWQFSKKWNIIKFIMVRRIKINNLVFLSEKYNF